DGKVGGFGREMVPMLKKSDYSGALTLLTSRIARTISDNAHVTLDTVGAPPGLQTTIVPAPTATVPASPMIWNRGNIIGLIYLISFFRMFIATVWFVIKLAMKLL